VEDIKGKKHMHKGPKMHHIMPVANEPNSHSGPKDLHLSTKDKEMLTNVRTLGWSSNKEIRMWYICLLMILFY